MLTDAEVKILVTQEALREHLPVTGCETVCLDVDAARLAELDSSNLPDGDGADKLAYTMYTSGSTGQPKGVQIPHSAVVNFLSSMAAEPGLASHDRLLAVTTPAFDISVLELLLPLSVGACVDVASSELTADATGLAARLSESGATVMQATPTTWQMLINGGWEGKSGLKVLCGGEALPEALAEDLQQRCGELWNVYGPTETTIWSTLDRVGAAWRQGTIGHPIANTQVYVLGAQKELVPIGVPGELHIGGAGLARGYLNRAELTEERFVANPFDDDAESQLYRTGDLCRWRAEGSLEFLGRIDDQVKLRGFRIELGEIESVLNDHSKVAQSAVVLRDDDAQQGDKHLVAYCVATAETELNVSELRTHLRSRLPDYMLPAAFVDLDALPMTSSGKVDRRALPAPDDSRPDLDTGFVAPRTPIEEELGKIWCEILGIEKVGIRDNFFALGGHSLMVVRLTSQIRQEFNAEVLVRTVFELPTIEGLALSMLEQQLLASESLESDAM